MRHKLKNYFLRNFGFSNSEIRGIYVLIPFMAISFITPSVFHKYVSSDNEDLSPKEQELLEQWIVDSKLKLRIDDDNKRKGSSRVLTEHFDPNAISVSQWLEKGFSESVAKRIRKYLNKGGRFNKKEDLLKMYGIDKRLAKAYFDYMYIAPLPKIATTGRETVKPTRPSSDFESKKPFVKLDLNHMDTTDLKKIRGIGSYYSTKLIDYRGKLGGFIHVDQLLEIYGVDTIVQNLIVKNTTLTPKVPEQININNADFDELIKHPYLDYKATIAILKYKKQHGPYENVEGLKKILILKDSVYLKVKPYLKVID